MIAPLLRFLALAVVVNTVAGAAAAAPVAPENLRPAPPGQRTAKKYSWETPPAKVSATGGLEWAPLPFVFTAGESRRFIDFENGDDRNDGRSITKPWKHHPWDPKAAATAAAGTGVHTYVFKRGSVYRGTLTARESGDAGNPIRLTSDPSWGRGEAIICGSTRLAGGWSRGVTHADIPANGNVWCRDMDFSPRTLWLIRGVETTRIPLARMPNWAISDPEDIKSEWWSWDYPGSKSFDVYMKNERGRELVLGIDTKHITGPKELYLGAILWAEFGWVDGTPYPSYVQGFDPEKKGVGFEGYLGSARSRRIARHHRYYFEDKPHYLDDSRGEFWFERKGDGGRLHVVLPVALDPNTAVFEVGREATLITLDNQRHVAISGLAFQFTNVDWSLTELPWGPNYALKPQVYPACIRVWGGGEDITVSHCSFRDVNGAVFMKAVTPGRPIDRVAVTDCEIRDTDHGGITIQEGIQWGHTSADAGGYLFDVKILRNRIVRTGQRPMRVGSANAIDVGNAQTVEIAGNIIDRPWHAGVNVHAAKISGNLRDVPLSRVLIHHNRVIDGIRTGDDCGNIETWQGGPAYVYNNVSGNPGGFRNASWMTGKDDRDRPGSARFGMAYYLDGAFKNYYFNNIGWGLSADPWSRVGATTMFQEIISYQNAFFNNTAYRFVKGSRRQAPEGGRNKFIGNLWDGIGDWVFWHTTPAKSLAEGNERDAGTPKTRYALETNAFTGNVFHDITGRYAAFKPSGQWHETLESARSALNETGAIAADLGRTAAQPPMRDPANRDFSLAAGSAAIDQSGRVFVPWSLYATVGEWSFSPAGNDPSRILDEHWYMAPYYYGRDDYHTKPMFDLRGVNIRADDYVAGPLEDWTKGALRLNGRDQYAICADSVLSQKLAYRVKFRWEQNGREETRHAEGRDFKSPQIYDSNFLIEAYFRTEPGAGPGVIVEKRSGSGYSLAVNASGGMTLEMSGGGATAVVSSSVAVNDGRWHHVIAEADRTAGTMTLYFDGRKDRAGAGLRANVSLENKGDLYVGGTPAGRCFHGTIDFLRICLGTLADAKTDIEELYAWQSDGPFLRDFAGRTPRGRRDAGALEKTD
ncbi:MAG: LamG domain-containing protein [Opitutaceae bacterium]|nr:LamG domain-containing protein [Opitutaceae bacterium]